MKDNILSWAIAFILDKLKVQPLVVMIIASVLMAVSYGAGYFNEVCGNCLPTWVADWQLRLGIFVGLLLQSRTTKVLQTAKKPTK